MWQTCLVQKVALRGPELMDQVQGVSANFLNATTTLLIIFFSIRILNKNSVLNKNTSMEFCSFRPSVLSSFYWIELAESKITDGKDKQIFSHALTLTNTHREHNCLNSLSLGSKTKTEVFTWNSKAEQPGSGRLSARSLFSVNQCGGQWSSTNLHQVGSPSSILD